MNSNAIYSTMVRDGKVTLFIDVKERKGKAYLQITESKRKPNGEMVKTTITVYNPDTCVHLKEAIGEAVEAMNYKPKA